MGDRICVMNEGEVVQIGRPLDVYREPADTFVARFLGNPPMNLLPAMLRRSGSAYSLDVANSSLPVIGFEPEILAPFTDMPISIGIRPEDIYETAIQAGCASPAGLIARITAVEPLGAETLLMLSLPGQSPECIARVGRNTAHRRGEEATLFLTRRPCISSTRRPRWPFRAQLGALPARPENDMATSLGVTDCHLHIIDPARFPFADGPGYRPAPHETGTREELAAVLAANGVGRAVLVQSERLRLRQLGYPRRHGARARPLSRHCRHRGKRIRRNASWPRRGWCGGRPLQPRELRRTGALRQRLGTPARSHPIARLVRSGPCKR